MRFWVGVAAVLAGVVFWSIATTPTGGATAIDTPTAFVIFIALSGAWLMMGPRSRRGRSRGLVASLFSGAAPPRRRAMPTSMRHHIWIRDGKRCQKCNRSLRDIRFAHIDHIRPLARGGSDDAGNLQLLCVACNQAKGDRW